MIYRDKIPIQSVRFTVTKLILKFNAFRFKKKTSRYYIAQIKFLNA